MAGNLPHSAPQPPRWEDLPEKVRAKTEHNMRLAGTSIDQMSRDFGAQLDQAIWRAHTAGMKNGETRTITHGSGKSVKVQYESEQALGDNGRPAKGFTVGYYHTTPAAEQAAARISSLFQDRRHLADER